MTSPFVRTADGLLARENFTAERLAAWQAELSKLPDATPFLTAEEREASRRATLRAVAPGAEVWVFGYGSLMWNPAIHVAESRKAVVTGLRRAFCLHVELGRATPETPGLMLAVEHCAQGGRCVGVAHRIAPEHVESETAILWMREMLTGAYLPHWFEAEFGGRTALAFTFVINSAHRRYEGGLSAEEVALRIARAEGLMGTNRDYLYRTAAHLRALGVECPDIHPLEQRVRALAGDAAPR